MTCFAACQVKILKNNLQFLSEETEELKIGLDVKNEIIYEKIKTCIKHQNAILESVKHFSLFSFIRKLF